jgi:hypothetical protein
VSVKTGQSKTPAGIAFAVTFVAADAGLEGAFTSRRF